MHTSSEYQTLVSVHGFWHSFLLVFWVSCS